MAQPEEVKYQPQHSVYIVESQLGSQRTSLEEQNCPRRESWLSKKLPWLAKFSPNYDRWQPGWFAQFPWTGFFCLIIVIALSACSVLTIYLSNNKSVKAHTRWNIKIGPNVLLSLINNITGIFMTVAIGQAVAISWWRRVMKKPATVEELHVFWSFSSSLKSIALHLKLFNVIAFTFLVAKIGIADSMLFQKSLGTVPGFGAPQNGNVSVYPASTFPFIGDQNGQANDITSMNYRTTVEFTTWINTGNNIDVYMLNGFYCEDLCELKYSGIGFWSNCSYTNETDVSRSPNAVAAGYNTLFDLQFNQKWRDSDENYSYIEMTWAAWNPSNNVTEPYEACAGQYQHLTCDLRPAIIEYPIAVSNYSVYIGDLDMTYGDWAGYPGVKDVNSPHQLSNHTWLKWLDIPETPELSGKSQLGGIVAALQTVFNAHSSVEYVASQTSNTSSTGVTTNWTATFDAKGSYSYIMQQEDSVVGCPPGYDGPLEQPGDPGEPSQNTYSKYSKMLYDINMLMLIMSDDFENRADYNKSSEDPDYYTKYLLDNARDVDAMQIVYVTLYTADMKYAWLAFGSTIMMVLLTLPGYYGYWELGRRVSLDPLEMANAFNAPMLRAHDTGSGDVDGLLANTGKSHVQYNRQSDSHLNGGERYCFRSTDPPAARVTPLLRLKVHPRR